MALAEDGGVRGVAELEAIAAKNAPQRYNPCVEAVWCVADLIIVVCLTIGMYAWTWLSAPCHNYASFRRRGMCVAGLSDGGLQLTESGRFVVQRCGAPP